MNVNSDKANLLVTCRNQMIPHIMSESETLTKTKTRIAFIMDEDRYKKYKNIYMEFTAHDASLEKPLSGAL